MAKPKGGATAPAVDDQIKTKKEAFEAALAEAHKKYGDGAVQKITDEVIDEHAKMEDTLSSGILQVDRVTRRGGFVKGMIVEVLGPESSGKTTLCLHTVAEVQKNGGEAIYVDMEHALQKEHVNNCGIKELNIVQPSTGEEAIDLVESFAKAGTDVIIVDSVSALVPEDELNAESGKQLPGLQARLMSQHLRKLVGIAKRGRSTVIFINQIRYKIGVMFGNPETTSGGNSLKFYASLRLDMRRQAGKELKMNEDVVANLVKIKAIKNKTAQPYAQEEFYMFFDAKKTVAANVLEFGSEIGVIQKSGSWYQYNNEKLGQGLAQAVNNMVQKPELVEKLLKECRVNLFKPVVKIDQLI